MIYNVLEIGKLESSQISFKYCGAWRAGRFKHPFSVRRSLLWVRNIQPRRGLPCNNGLPVKIWGRKTFRPYRIVNAFFGTRETHDRASLHSVEFVKFSDPSMAGSLLRYDFF